MFPSVCREEGEDRIGLTTAEVHQVGPGFKISRTVSRWETIFIFFIYSSLFFVFKEYNYAVNSSFY